MRIQTVLVAIGLLVVTLTGCPSAQRPATPASPVSAPATAPTSVSPSKPVSQRYRILADESLLQVVVRKGGALAAAGHNHIVASRHLRGTVDLREPLTASSFELLIPLALMTVDEPELRKGRGEEFPPNVSESARDGTRKNMLGTALLDADRFPGLSVTSVSVAGGPSDFTARVAVKVKDLTTSIDVPVRIERSNDRLRATGAFAVKQTELGLEPFSALMGALKVQDELNVEFVVVAAP